jgi:hypothetical protein
LVARQLQAMQTEQLVAQPLDAELTGTAQLQDQPLLFGKDAPLRRGFWSVATILKTSLTLGGVASDPLAQGRS